MSRLRWQPGRVETMTLSTAEIDAVAQVLTAARAAGERITAPALPLDDVTDAYRIQDAVSRRHRGIDGWKVGAKSPAAIATCAPLLRGTVIDMAELAGGDIPVKGQVGIEVEIAYRLGRRFPVGSVLRDEEILDAITATHIAVEVCASRFADCAETEPLWLLADNQMNKQLVIGASLPPGANPI